MEFKEVIREIESLLGKELQSLSAPEKTVIIVSLNDGRGVRVSKKGEKTLAISYRLFEQVWDDLSRDGFVSVDRALYGSGTSRNRLETILANLPFVQHFKYKRKKHLLLRDKNVHESGTLSELSSSDMRSIVRKVDVFHSLSHKESALYQEVLVNSLKGSLDVILKKYPGEARVSNVTESLKALLEMAEKSKAAVVTLDTIKSGVDHELQNPLTAISADTVFENEFYTGIEDDDSESEDLVDSEHKTSRKRLKIRQIYPTLSIIYDRIEYNEVDLQPDFQRNDRIWDAKRKSRLIESILMGLPLPIFYLGEESNGDWVIVDGLQRITSIYDFMRGSFALKGLEKLAEFEGKSFSDLHRTSQRTIREYQVTAHLFDIRDHNYKDVAELFHRINTYGVKLSAQEIRSALIGGSSIKFLRYLSDAETFNLATHGKVNPSRQKNIELCLGAVSYMLFGYKSFNYSRYDDFLSNAMRTMNEETFSVLNDVEVSAENSYKNAQVDFSKSEIYGLLSERFLISLEFTYQIFNDYAFRKSRRDINRQPISKPLFETLVACFSCLSKAQMSKVEASKNELIDFFFDAITNNSDEYSNWNNIVYKEAGRGFNDSISQSTGKKIMVEYRFESVLNIIKKSTGVDIVMKGLTNDKYLDKK